MDPRPVAQWAEIVEKLRAEHGDSFTLGHIAERVIGDLIGYAHPNVGNSATHRSRQIRKDHDVAELANALTAVVQITVSEEP